MVLSDVFNLGEYKLIYMKLCGIVILCDNNEIVMGELNEPYTT